MAVFKNHTAMKLAMIKELDRLQDSLLDDVLITVKKRTKEKTGELRESWERKGDKVGSDVDHARYYEYGSKKRGIKAGRPMRKAIGRIKRILKKKVKEAKNRL